MRIALGIAVAFSIASGAGAYAYLDTKTASAKACEGVAAKPRTGLVDDSCARDEVRIAGQVKR